MVTKTALVAWGSGALAVSTAGVIAVTQLASAAPAPAPTSATSSTAVSGGSMAAATNNGNSGNGNNGNGNGNSGSTPTGKALTVTGVVTGKVAPGLPAVLTVTVANPNNQAVILRSVTGTVTGVAGGTANSTLPACSKAWFSIGSFSSTTRTIAKNASTTVPLPVTLTDLAATNQDNCKNATYSFSFAATADQA